MAIVEICRGNPLNLVIFGTKDRYHVIENLMYQKELISIQIINEERVTILKKCTFSICTFINSIFKNIDFGTSVIKTCSFEYCRFENCEFYSAQLEGVYFYECDFYNCKFEQTEKAKFENCLFVFTL